ncbi:hypothetical protein BDV93DRAFT_565008 [Ceratobasidium sp. AG-I]|nr:hypothetical protein BDV93DRAFT_565008 [Ceratobasidium sp. AG-I]
MPQPESAFRMAEQASDDPNEQLDNLTGALPSRALSPVMFDAPEQLALNDLPVEGEANPPPELSLDYLNDAEERLCEAALAKDDPSYLRLLYLNAVTSNTLRNHTIESTEANLKVSLESLRMAGALTLEHTVVSSLEAVRRRLGLETDGFMIKQPVCDKCYKPCSHNDIAESESSLCTMLGCSGNFWRVVLKKNQETRRPIKLVIYTKLIIALRRMFLRPSFIRSLKAGKDAHIGHEATEGLLNDICDGSAWNSARFGMHRSFHQDGNVQDEPEQPGSEKAAKELGYGLLGSLNIDWFKNNHHDSTGAIYLTILNLHRSARYLPANTILVCLVPGPGEPSLENLNYVLDPIVEQFKQLYAGVVMKIYEQELPATVHLQPIINSADVPARAKTQGVAGHRHNKKFCICNCPRSSVDTEAGYAIHEFVITDDNIALKQAWLSKIAPSAAQRNTLHKTHGIRWSSFNSLPDWKPNGSAPFDIMHNLYLGIVNDLWTSVLMRGYYFTATQRRDLDVFLETVVWPGHIGRLPKNPCEHGGLRKADEWRRLISVLPVALWAVWGNAEGKIPPGAPPVPPKGTPPEFQRCQATLYRLVVLLSAASRLLTTWAVQMPDIHRAQTYLQFFCQGLLQMNVRMKPNHHYCMHYEATFQRFGPAYAWWLFAYERYNGLLESVNTNGKIEDISTTLMRFWIRMHRLLEYVESIPDGVTEQEKDIISSLCFARRNCGTLLETSANLSDGHLLEAPKFAAPLDLHSLGPGIYSLFLAFAQSTWPQLNFSHEQDYNQAGNLFLAKKVARHLNFIKRSGIRFGSSSSAQTDADRYVLARLDGRQVPCQIEWLVRLQVAHEDVFLCAVVSPFVSDHNIMRTPWDLYASDLGYNIAYANHLGAKVIIPALDIVSPVALAPVPTQQVWVAIAYDRVRGATSAVSSRLWSYSESLQSLQSVSQGLQSLSRALWS